MIAASVLAMAGIVGTAIAPGASASAAKPKFGCHGTKATIVGSNHRDRLRGTPRRDVIVALGGADRISRVKRGDIVCSGAGRDVVGSHFKKGKNGGGGGGTAKGGALGYMVLSGGDDELTIDCDPGGSYPDSAYNQVDAGPGDDRLESNCPFHDNFAGGPGDDWLKLGRGEDLAVGEDGNDRLIDAYSVPKDCRDDFPPLEWDFGYPDRRCVYIAGGPYDFEDFWYGGTGDDVVVGGEANDLIFGEEGDDTLGGGPGGDAVSGGPGYDVCDGGPGEGDTQSGEGYAAIDDCEELSGFEPVGDPILPHETKDCSSTLDPEGYEDCLKDRASLVELTWSPNDLDLSSPQPRIEWTATIYDATPGTGIPCDDCAANTSIASIHWLLKSDNGKALHVFDDCSPPNYEDTTFTCSGWFSFSSDSNEGETWSVVLMEIVDDWNGSSRYNRADLANPNLFPETWTRSYDTFMHTSDAP